MLHGATMDHRLFNFQVAALLPTYRVMVWDARGHGKSQPSGGEITLDLWTDDLLHILDEIGATSFVLVGQSLGAYIAQHVYKRAPERVLATVIIGATPLHWAYSRWDVWRLQASLPVILFLFPRSTFESTVASTIAVKAPGQLYARIALQAVSRDEFTFIWRAVTLAIDTKGDPSLKLGGPLLLMHGEADRNGSIKRDMPRWAEEAQAQAEYHVIPGAAHNANQDNPEVVNSHLLDFLARHV